MAHKQTKWTMFWNLLTHRLVSPWSEPPFFFHFFGIIILIGGLGIWLPRFVDLMKTGTSDWTTVSRDLCTYYVAILATSQVDLINEGSKTLRYFTNTIWSLGGIVAILIFVNSTLHWVTAISIIATVLALLMWVITNSDKADYIEVSPEDAFGKPAIGPAGTLENFKH